VAIYEYDCRACGERFEIRASEPTAAAELTCPVCGEDRISRYYGSVSLVARSRERAALRSTIDAGGDPLGGELRPADPGDLTRNVARSYARAGADSATREISRRAERGDGPAELKEFVRDVKSQQVSKRSSSRPPEGAG